MRHAHRALLLAGLLFPVRVLAQSSSSVDSSSVGILSSSDLGSSSSDPGVSSSAAASSSSEAASSSLPASSSVDTASSAVGSSSSAAGSSSSAVAASSSAAGSSAGASSSTAGSSTSRPSSSSVVVDAGPPPCVPGCHNNNHVVRFCMDGQTFNRTCASDEICRNAMCVLVNPPDAGSTCLAGCASSMVVRRCVGGEPQDTMCPGVQVCQSGNCVLPPVPDAGGLTGVDAGCVNTCVNETTLRACTGGVTITVTCNADSPCKDGECTPPPDNNPGGNCGCTGLSSLGTLMLAGLVMRRPRRRNV